MDFISFTHIGFRMFELEWFGGVKVYVVAAHIRRVQVRIMAVADHCDIERVRFLCC